VKTSRELKLDATALADQAIAFEFTGYLRATLLARRATPLGMGFGKTRFASPDDGFKVLYAAESLATSVAETLVRDRFEGRKRRRLHQAEVETWGVTEVSTSAPLALIDIRTTGLTRLGVSTDAAGAKSHRHGRRLSKAVYEQSDADGILYVSRLTRVTCCAIFDRAAAKLVAMPVVEIMTLVDLVPALTSLKVQVVPL
jgi:hypothetical protein